MTQFHWALDANRTDDHEDILAKEIKATSDETVNSVETGVLVRSSSEEYFVKVTVR